MTQVAAERIPLVDLAAQYATIRDEVRAAWDEALGSMRLLFGPNCEAFDREFAAYCGTSHAMGVASGTDALHLALRALGIGPGDEVVTVSFTFFATVEAISYLGARPVLVDVDEAAALMDVRAALAAVTPRTKAILPVHLYGRTVRLARLVAAGVPVVEDAAQAHGAALDVAGRAGSGGAAGAFSFYLSKNLGAYGEAGSVTTSDDGLAGRLRLLRHHGQRSRHSGGAAGEAGEAPLSERHEYESVLVGYNARLDELQAAVLRIKLRRLDRWNARRREIARRYDALLRGVGDLVLPPLPEGEEHVFHLYVIRTARRAELARHLADRGIATGIHYPIPIHLQPAWAELGYRSGSLPVTERLSREVLSLPMYAELSERQIERIAGAVSDFFS